MTRAYGRFAVGAKERSGQMIEQIVNLERMEEAINIFGSFDENMRIIEKALGVTVLNREDHLKVTGQGEQVMQAVKV
ncbi:MAG: PhoH-like protein, partial [Firmicutes bacterium]|nr:PhoH-like protein [Bacillota bacterium]